MNNHNSTPLKALLHSAVWTSALKVLAAAASFVVSLIIARSLGAEQTGVFMLTLSIVTVLAVAARLGLGPVLTRRIAALSSEQLWPDVNAVFLRGFSIVVATAGAATLLLFLLSDWLINHIFKLPALASTIPFMAMAIAPLTLSFLLGHAFQGRGKIKTCLLLQNLGVSLIFVLFVGVWFLASEEPAEQRELSIHNFATIYVAATVALLLVGSLGWYLQAPARTGGKDISSLAMLRDAMPIYGTVMLAVLMQHAAPLLLGYWLSSTDVAIYAIALRVAALLALLLAAFNVIAMPRFAALHHQGDKQGLEQLAKQITRILIVLGIPGVAAIAIFSEFILSFFGPEFVVGEQVLRILVLGQLVNLATGAVGSLLTMTGNARYSLRSSVVATLVMLGMSSWLIPSMGVIGAAIAQASALSVQMIMNSIAVKRTLGFFPI